MHFKATKCVPVFLSLSEWKIRYRRCNWFHARLHCDTHFWHATYFFGLSFIDRPSIALNEFPFLLSHHIDNRILATIFFAKHSDSSLANGNGTCIAPNTSALKQWNSIKWPKQTIPYFDFNIKKTQREAEEKQNVAQIMFVVFVWLFCSHFSFLFHFSLVQSVLMFISRVSMVCNVTE